MPRISQEASRWENVGFAAAIAATAVLSVLDGTALGVVEYVARRVGEVGEQTLHDAGAMAVAAAQREPLASVIPLRASGAGVVDLEQRAAA